MFGESWKDVSAWIHHYNYFLHPKSRHFEQTLTCCYTRQDLDWCERIQRDTAVTTEKFSRIDVHVGETKILKQQGPHV